MKNTLIIILLFALASSCKQSGKSASDTGDEKITVAAYYFANYHTGDPRNVKQKGEGWSEW